MSDTYLQNNDVMEQAYVMLYGHRTREEFMDSVREELGQPWVDLHNKLWDKYGKPECGTGRAAYIGKHVVFKVPRNLGGVRANDWEGSLDSSPNMPLAKTRFLNFDLMVIAMEKIAPATTAEIINKLGKVPDFVSSVDMGQVGWNKKGQLVAFDYGH